MNLPPTVFSYAPREVPLSIRLVVLFGSPFSRVGWLISGIGLIFAVLFVGNADFSSWIYFRGPLETAPGIVTASGQTHSSEGGNKYRRGTPIFRHEYKFNFAGCEFTGVSYCTGGGLRDHQSVTVEFPAGQPNLSRIRDMRRALFKPAVALVLIIPTIGFVFVAVGFWTGRKNLFLLINGEAAQARNAGKEPTNSRVNNRMVYKVWFEFTDRTGQMQKTFTRTSRPENLKGNVFELLFYDGNQPSRSVLLHALPGKLELDERGGFKGSTFWAVLGALLGPLFVATVLIVGLLVQGKLR